MKTLWNGEKVHPVFRILGGLIAVAFLITMTFSLIEPSDSLNYFDLFLGTFCLAYVLTVFISVAIRGKAPSGIIPWR
jgi:hypothetical protein